MSARILFVVIGALGTGLWNVFISSAARQVPPLLGAVICELTAVAAGVMMLLPALGPGLPKVSFKAAALCMLAGLSVLAADYFILKAYKQGPAVSVGGPILIGGGILVVTLAGVFLGERMTLLKALSILMILAGASILGGLSR